MFLPSLRPLPGLLLSAAFALSACGGGGGEAGAATNDGGAPPLSASTSAITAAKLSTCPETNTVDPAHHLSTGPAAFQCMAGELSGLGTGLTPEEPCTLRVTGDGKFTLVFRGASYVKSGPFAATSYMKNAGTGTFGVLLDTAVREVSFFGLSAGGPAAGAGNVFTGEGGGLAATYTSADRGTSISCLFEVK